MDDLKSDGAASPGSDNQNNNNNNNIVKGDSNGSTVKNDKLSSIVAACGEKILNPEFLLQGGGKLFTDNGNGDKKDGTGSVSEGLEKRKTNVGIRYDEDNSSTKSPSSVGVKVEDVRKKDEISCVIKKETDDIKLTEPEVTLYSQKMKGLKDIFLAEKLNTNAISLQITAQSQVSGKKPRSGSTGGGCYGSDFDMTSRPKRARRD